MTGFLAGKRALIVGVLNNRSIAYGIAKSMHNQGAELAFTYLNDQLKERVETVATEFGSKIILPCDVSSDEQIKTLFESLQSHWDKFDILVHSVAFAPSGQLEGNYVDSVTREGFKVAHDISSYSFVALAKHAYPLMEGRNGSMLTLTYLGAVRAMPSYNVMGLAKASLEANVRYMAYNLGPKGIRVNAVSAGPVKTLAASGVKNFRKMLSDYEAVAPLRRNVTLEQVGDTSAFLCSDMAGGITGEILYVDSGFHMVAMGDLEKV